VITPTAEATRYVDATEWLAEQMGAEIRTASIAIVADWMTGPRDGYAEAKAHRQLMQLAEQCREKFRISHQDQKEAA
jgi:hypothetical protein